VFSDRGVEIEKIRDWQISQEEPAGAEQAHSLARPFPQRAQEKYSQHHYTSKGQRLGRERDAPICVTLRCGRFKDAALNVKLGGKDH